MYMFDIQPRKYNKHKPCLLMFGKVSEMTLEKLEFNHQRENGGTLGMVPLIINPIYTLYSGHLLGLRALLKGSLGG